VPVVAQPAAVRPKKSHVPSRRLTGADSSRRGFLVDFGFSATWWAGRDFVRYTVKAVSLGASQEQSARIRGVAILDRLVAEGNVSPSLYDEVLMHAQRTQSTAEEAILQLGLMSEAELLKYIATLYRTRFVGSDRLAKAAVDPQLLKKVPRKLAKRLTAFPILYDKLSRCSLRPARET